MGEKTYTRNITAVVMKTELLGRGKRGKNVNSRLMRMQTEELYFLGIVEVTFKVFMEEVNRGGKYECMNRTY